MLFKLAPCALTVYLLLTDLVDNSAYPLIFPVIKITGNNCNAPDCPTVASYP